MAGETGTDAIAAALAGSEEKERAGAAKLWVGSNSGRMCRRGPGAWAGSEGDSILLLLVVDEFAIVDVARVLATAD